MVAIGSGVSLRGITHEDFHYPFNLASGMTIADVGKAVALDTTAPRTVKIAAATEEILGVLVSFEDRTVEGIKVGTVALKGGVQLTAVSGHSIVVGDYVEGSATAGQVQESATHKNCQVVAVSGDTLEVIFK